MRATIVSLLILIAGCAADSTTSARMDPQTELAPDTWPFKDPAWVEAADSTPVDADTTVVFECEVLRVNGTPDDPARCALLAAADLETHTAAVIDADQAKHVRALHTECPTGEVLSTPRLLVYPNQTASIGIGSEDGAMLRLFFKTAVVAPRKITFRYAMQAAGDAGEKPTAGDRWSVDGQTTLAPGQVSAARATNESEDTTLILLISTHTES